MSDKQIDDHQVSTRQLEGPPGNFAVLYRQRVVGRIWDSGKRCGEKGLDVIYEDETHAVHYGLQAGAIEICRRMAREGRLNP
jgi:hypothetical protein